MGLDIYAYRVKKSVADKYGLSMSSDGSEIYKAIKSEQLKKFTNYFKRKLAILRLKYEEESPIEYSKTYSSFVLELAKKVDLYREYDFYLQSFGYNRTNHVFNEIKTPNEVEEVYKEHLASRCAIEDAYFRKVNFIYAFFQHLIKDETCIVDKSMIGKLLNTCKDVLAHKFNTKYAEENLPTTSGFFFGSTEYDNWYYQDVEDCIKQMKKLYKSMNEEDFVYWYFSW